MKLKAANVKVFTVQGTSRRDILGLLRKVLRQSIGFIKEHENIGKVRFQLKLIIREKA